MDFLDKLAPYGPGNMRPNFASKQVEIVGNPRVIGNGDHIVFKIRQNQKIISAIGFNTTLELKSTSLSSSITKILPYLSGIS